MDRELYVTKLEEIIELAVIRPFLKRIAGEDGLTREVFFDMLKGLHLTQDELDIVDSICEDITDGPHTIMTRVTGGTPYFTASARCVNCGELVAKDQIHTSIYSAKESLKEKVPVICPRCKSILNKDEIDTHDELHDVTETFNELTTKHRRGEHLSDDEVDAMLAAWNRKMELEKKLEERLKK